MKETKCERGKSGREKKNTQVNHLSSAWTLYKTFRKINDNSCIKIIKRKNIKNESFSYACVVCCIKFFNDKIIFIKERRGTEKRQKERDKERERVRERERENERGTTRKK